MDSDLLYFLYGVEETSAIPFTEHIPHYLLFLLRQASASLRAPR